MAWRAIMFQVPTMSIVLTENFDSFPELFWHFKGSDCENIIICLACRSCDVTRLRLYSLLYAGLLDLFAFWERQFLLCIKGLLSLGRFHLLDGRTFLSMHCSIIDRNVCCHLVQ